MSRLKDAVALVTGASDRLGRAMSVGLAREGAHVVIHYHTTKDKAIETKAMVEAQGRRAILLPADLSDSKEIHTLVDKAMESFGRLDILVNNAALFEPGNLQHTTFENWDRQFAVNLKAPFFLSQFFISGGTAPGERQIVFIAGVRGIRPDSERIAYSLTKAGLVTLTEMLAEEVAPDVRVNALAPGAILSPAGMSEEGYRRVISTVPLMKSGSAEDVVEGLLYILTAPYLTGVVLPVTGGSHTRGFHA